MLQLNEDADEALAGEEEVLAPVIPAATPEQRQATGAHTVDAAGWVADPVFGWSCALPGELVTR